MLDECGLVVTQELGYICHTPPDYMLGLSSNWFISETESGFAVYAVNDDAPHTFCGEFNTLVQAFNISGMLC